MRVAGGSSPNLGDLSRSHLGSFGLYDMSMKVAVRRLPLLLCAALALAAVPAFAADFDPHNFDVRIEGQPGSRDGGGQPSCTGDPGGVQTCVSSFDVVQEGQKLTGTVSEKSEGLSGTIETICDFNLHQRQVVEVSSSSFTLVEFSGSGKQSCSWFMDFGGGTTLAGTISGSMKMGLVSSTKGYFGGTFNVVVVAGTGVFEGTVGTGVFEEYEEMSFDPPQMPSAPSDDTYAAQLARSLAARGQEGSAMRLKLREGKPLAKIVSPGAKLAASADTKLKVVTVPGASCQASAKRGAKRIDLGQATDTDKNGLTVFSGRLVAKLKSGAWSLSSSCHYTLAGKSGTTKARSNVKIA